MHGAVFIYRLVHPDEFLEGQSVGALGAKAERRVHVLEHVVHLGVVDAALRARVVFRPDPGNRLEEGGRDHKHEGGIVDGEKISVNI